MRCRRTARRPPQLLWRHTRLLLPLVWGLVCRQAAASQLPECGCGLLVFRHVQKTGGSTLRHYFRMQELTGDWEFYSPQGDGRWPETSNRVRTQVLLGFWEALMSPSVNFTETPRRIIMEWHAEAHLVPPWERAVEIVTWLRRAARVRGCPVMLFTLLRRPVDVYPSWWRYEGVRMTRGQGLLPWIADNPNIQASTLMAGVSRPAALPFDTHLHEGRFDRMRVWEPRDAAALRMLLRQFDVIAPMERFQEAMFLVAHTMGIQHLGYTIINDGTKRDLWSSFRANLTAEDVRRMETYSSGWVPAEDAQLVGAVDAHAPVDIRMYDQAVQQFDAQLASLEPGVSALMREYVAMPDVAGWHGHKPPQKLSWFLSVLPMSKAVRVMPYTLRRNDTVGGVFSLVPSFSNSSTPPALPRVAR